jgi:hypothetical protein
VRQPNYGQQQPNYGQQQQQPNYGVRKKTRSYQREKDYDDDFYDEKNCKFMPEDVPVQGRLNKFYRALRKKDVQWDKYYTSVVSGDKNLIKLEKDLDKDYNKKICDIIEHLKKKKFKTMLDTRKKIYNANKKLNSRRNYSRRNSSYSSYRQNRQPVQAQAYPVEYNQNGQYIQGQQGQYIEGQKSRYIPGQPGRYIQGQQGEYIKGQQGEYIKGQPDNVKPANAKISIKTNEDLKYLGKTMSSYEAYKATFKNVLTKYKDTDYPYLFPLLAITKSSKTHFIQFILTKAVRTIYSVYWGTYPTNEYVGFYPTLEDLFQTFLIDNGASDSDIYYNAKYVLENSDSNIKFHTGNYNGVSNVQQIKEYLNNLVEKYH